MLCEKKESEGQYVRACMGARTCASESKNDYCNHQIISAVTEAFAGRRTVTARTQHICCTIVFRWRKKRVCLKTEPSSFPSQHPVLPLLITTTKIVILTSA
jgi:hypothetical protein